MSWYATSIFCLVCVTSILLMILGFFMIQSYNRGRRNDNIWLVEYLERKAHERQQLYLWICVLGIVGTIFIVGLALIAQSR